MNGVVRTYEYLRKELVEMGYDVTIIGPADFPYSIAMPGYDEIRLALLPYNRLRRMIAACNPDVLHIATEGPLGRAARKYAAEYGVEFTSCYHTHFPDYIAKRVAQYLPFLYEPVRKAAISYVRNFHKISSCVFVATQTLEDTLRGWGFTAPLKRMTRGIDHDIFSIGPKTLFETIRHPVALYVGRVAIEKNLESFLSMEWNGTKVVVGSGPDRDTLQKKYPLSVFTGPKTGTELANHYRSADVFVFPSRTDTFGMVLIEAMACGIPIAAYPVPGPIDIVTKPFLGTLSEELSKAAHMAMTQGTPLERAAHARENYSWRKATHQFLETD